ncbi:Uncharacterised protein [uncultured archaeon]|nr:Uncharacterised protein [uncultured archaeon]
MLGGIQIKAINLILSVFMMGILVATGAAFDGANDRGHSPDGGIRHDVGDRHQNHDWLNPGGVVYSYKWWTPTYYDYTWYPTYTYPTYYYTTPIVYPTYTYNPIDYSYDPWWQANAYGWAGANYYYSSSWTWTSHHGGFFF